MISSTAIYIDKQNDITATDTKLTTAYAIACYMINVNIPYFTWIFTMTSAVILIQNIVITLSPVVNSINVMISLRYGRVSYSRPLAGGTCWSQRWYLHGVSTILAVAAFTASRYWSGSVLKPSNWFKMMCLHNTFHLKQFILLHNTEYFILIKINSQLNYSEIKQYSNNSHNHRNAVITNLSLHNCH